MATYASYKKVNNDSIADATITSADIAHGNGNNMGVKWIIMNVPCVVTVA